MKRGWVIALIVTVYVVGLLVHLPARVVTQSLTQFAPLPADVTIQRVQGTIWRGELGRLQVGEHVLQDLSWRIYPLSMLAGGLGLDLSVRDMPANPFQGSGHVYVRRNQLEVSDLQVRGDIGVIGQWLKIPDLVPLRGDLIFGVNNFAMGEPVCHSLAARLAVFDVSTRIGRQWHDLGDYVMSFSCADGWIDVTTDPDNLLGLNVNGRFIPAQVDLGVDLQPRAEAPAPIHDLLRLVGEPDASGRYSWRFRL
ncbi:MAG: type II secretion system protein N [Idiomarina sp.]|nr:type II secretion system protein N [Idiomarina sp.]